MGNLESLKRSAFIVMDRERESRVVPTLVAVVGVVAFAVFLYLLLAGADWIINRLFDLSAGTNI